MNKIVLCSRLCFNFSFLFKKKKKYCKKYKSEKKNIFTYTKKEIR